MTPSVLFIRGLAEKNKSYWRQRDRTKVKLHTNCFFKAPICVKLPVWVCAITLTTAFRLLAQDFRDVGFLKISQRDVEIRLEHDAGTITVNTA